MRRVSVFGSTGSIGESTFDLLRRDEVQVVALTGGRNVARLAEQARALRAELAVTCYPECLPALREALAGSGVETAAGAAALIEAADRPVDWAMSAIVGAAGLAPGFRALRHGGTLALANKESLVTAGPLLMAEAARHGARILPVDSEHSAIFQALRGERMEAVERVTLTASGGPFRSWPLARLAAATVAEASTHPNWAMGQRITIDSASMFNKAMELIETREFFGFLPDQIEVLVHPQSIVHALVAFRDGAVMAHMGAPDMRHAIGHALSWPERAALPVPRLDLARIGSLTFETPDEARFPALRLAREVMAAGAGRRIWTRCWPGMRKAGASRARPPPAGRAWRSEVRGSDLELLGLIPSFGGLVWTVLAFVVALSVIVAVHEYGHYIVGRWSGIKADVFSLGFGPRLYSRVDRHGTRWQFALLPLGGYVKFRGDADAASALPDAATVAGLSAAERRETMVGAPLWARTATVAAGPVFNFILSILVFAAIFLVQGIATERPAVGALRPLPGAAQELRPGDIILSVGGVATPDNTAFLRATNTLPAEPSLPYEVERGAGRLTVSGPFPLPPLVDGVQPQSPGAEAGLRSGDVILAVDGRPVQAFRELREIAGASDGAPMRLTVWRAGEVLEATVTPRRMDMPTADGFETRWMIGLSGAPAFVPETRRPGPVEALALGARQTWDIVATSLSGLAHMVTGAISSCNLRGPIGIAESSGAAASAGLTSFIWFIAVLSAAVGLMNLFPVPVLDGGHLVFFAWEAVTGRPPSDGALRVLMSVGFGLIITLMVFALTNDIRCP